ncbi:MAG TPA: hypothetical protein DCL54_09360, partial [Alphaproteobacteria bacterium]|nr:hypothetical protein [Alphaproteobacteria bacterium]
AALCVLYVIITAISAEKLNGMVRQLVTLRLAQESLTATLEREKCAADAARVRAEHASQAKSNFLANMSH